MLNSVTGRRRTILGSLFVAICTYTLYAAVTGEHDLVVGKAKKLQEEYLCPVKPQRQLEAAEGTKADGQTLDRFNNRLACDLCQPDDVFCLSIGEHNIARSVGYEGSNHRLEFLFHKLNSGLPITVSVVGGSNSAGHGLGHEGFPSELDSMGNMHYRVFDWIRGRWPNEGHRFVNGAIPGATTGLFAYCVMEQIPEDSDLVLVEFAVNDQVDIASVTNYERLIRGLLDLPHKPAVINLNVFSLAFATIGLGETQHQAVAQYYDTPVITTRNLLLPGIFKNASTAEDWFANPYVDGAHILDTRHVNFNAHRTMANLTTTYLSRVLCKMDERKRLADIGIDVRRSDAIFPAWDELGQIPKWPLMAQYDAKAPPLAKLRPQCMTTSSKTSPLKQETDEGWVEWAWKDKAYIVGRKPGDKVRLKFNTVIGTVALFYQRSSKYSLGVARCWVDSDDNRAIFLDGYWEYEFSTPQMTEIRGDLSPGEHVLTCEVNVDTNDPGGGTEFRLTTLVAL